MGAELRTAGWRLREIDGLVEAALYSYNPLTGGFDFLPGADPVGQGAVGQSGPEIPGVTDDEWADYAAWRARAG